MKIARLAVLLTLVFSMKSVAQQLSRVTSGIDVGLGYKEEAVAPSIMYHQELSLKHFSWLRIGWGIRGTGFFANKTDLVPKESSVSGDTLKFGKVSSNSLSFLVGANIRVWRFDIGANTDLIGFAFGTKRKGLYSQTHFNPGEGGYEFYNAYVSSSPSVFNVVPLALDNQSGQSEVYARYWINDRVGVKLGYVHGRVTYQTTEKLFNGQNKFSKSYGLPYVAISFPLYN